MLRLPGVGDVPFNVTRDDAAADDWQIVRVQGNNLRGAFIHGKGCSNGI